MRIFLLASSNRIISLMQIQTHLEYMGTTQILVYSIER